jgi:hypothetical protein
MMSLYAFFGAKCDESGECAVEARRTEKESKVVKGRKAGKR